MFSRYKLKVQFERKRPLTFKLYPPVISAAVPAPSSTSDQGWAWLLFTGFPKTSPKNVYMQQTFPRFGAIKVIYI